MPPKARINPKAKRAAQRTPPIAARPSPSSNASRTATKRRRSADDDDEDYEPEEEQEEKSQKKPRPDVVVKTLLGRGTGWSKQQDAAWLKALDKSRKEQQPFRDAVAAFGKICVRNKWPARTEESCRQRTKKLRPMKADYKWTADQMRFAYEAYYDKKMTRKTLAEQYNKEADKRGWPNRQEQTIIAKVYRLTRHDLDRHIQKEENGIKEEFALWTYDEDEMLKQWFHHSREQLEQDQLVLTAYMKKRHHRFKERTVAAIQKRINILKAERTSKRVKFWSINEDREATALIKDAKKVDDVAIPIAARFGVPLWFVQGRVVTLWRKLKGKLTRSAEPKPDARADEEEEELRQDPPDGWDGVRTRSQTRTAARIRVPKGRRRVRSKSADRPLAARKSKPLASGEAESDAAPEQDDEWIDEASASESEEEEEVLLAPPREVRERAIPSSDSEEEEEILLSSSERWGEVERSAADGLLQLTNPDDDDVSKSSDENATVPPCHMDRVGEEDRVIREILDDLIGTLEAEHTSTSGVERSHGDDASVEEEVVAELEVRRDEPEIQVDELSYEVDDDVASQASVATTMSQSEIERLATIESSREDVATEAPTRVDELNDDTLRQPPDEPDEEASSVSGAVPVTTAVAEDQGEPERLAADNERRQEAIQASVTWPFPSLTELIPADFAAGRPDREGTNPSINAELEEGEVAEEKEVEESQTTMTPVPKDANATPEVIDLSISDDEASEQTKRPQASITTAPDVVMRERETYSPERRTSVREKRVERSPSFSSDYGRHRAKRGKKSVSSQETAASDEDEDEDRVGAVTPVVSVTDEDEEVERNVEAMSHLLVTYRETVHRRRPVNGATLHLIGLSNLSREGETRRFMADVWNAFDERRKKGRHTLFECGRRVRTPEFHFQRIRELMFGITLLCRTNVTLVMFLRQLWDHDGVASYGKCRDTNCCLQYDVPHPHYRHEGNCRHWLYLNKMQVYLDEIASEADYRLTLALSTHLEAYWCTGEALQPSKKDTKDRGMTQVMLPIKAVGTLDQVFSWKEHDYTAQPKVLCQAITALVLAWDEDDEQQQASGDQQPWDFGEVVVLDQDKEVARATAALVHYDCWFIVTTLPVEIAIANVQKIKWLPKTNILNYQRRFTMIDRAHDLPMLKLMSQRSTFMEERLEDDLEKIKASQVLTELKDKLDDSQFNVVERLLKRTGILLCRGPFGSGKTTLIVSCIVAIRRVFPELRIAVVSETNAAIDEDLARLIDGGLVQKGEIWRLGNIATRMKGYSEFYLKEMLQKEREALEATVRSKRHRRELKIPTKLAQKEKETLLKSKIVVGTLSQLGREEYRDLEFHVIINDEGAQTVEAALVQALRKHTTVLMSAGDNQQLMGFSNLPERVRVKFADADRRHKLVWSILHSIPWEHTRRTGRDEFPGMTVSSVYRSHSQITSFLNAFYPYKLKCLARETPSYLEKLRVPGVEDRSLDNRLHGDRVVWIDADNAAYERIQENKVGSETRNETEVAMVIDLVMRIRAEVKRWMQSNRPEGEDPNWQMTRRTVFIITPYHDQRALIDKELRARAHWIDTYLKVWTATADSSQGREADVVIASMVRVRTLGFLADMPSRSLVSLSRARDYLFVLACRGAFRSDPTWRQLIENARRACLPYFRVRWTDEDALDILDDDDYMIRIGNVGT